MRLVPFGRRVVIASAAVVLAFTAVVVGPGAALAAPGYDKVVIAHQPDLYWRLGEVSGQVAVDSSGNDRDGTYHGPLALGQPGAIVGDTDTSAAFGGDEYYASFRPQSGYAGDFTLFAWIKKDQTDHVGQAIVSTRTEGAEFSFDLGLSQWTGVERLQVDVGNGNQWFSTGPGVPVTFDVGHWYQVAATVTSTAVTYYVDGQRIGAEQYPMGTGRPLLWDAGHTFTIGDSTRYSSDFFVGRLDEVAVFLRALSADTIRTLYLAASDPTPRAATTTTLSSSNNPSNTGDAVKFTATVADAAHPADVPSGTVTISADGTTLSDPITLDATGRATLTTASLVTGTHQVRAVYTAGSTAFWPSEGTLSQAVTQQRTTHTTLTVMPDQTVAGEDATFIATVTPAGTSATPTGTVQFSESDGTPIGDPVALDAGRANVVASGYAGHHTVRARYSGDSTFASSTGSVEQTINRADTVTTILSDPNPVLPGGELVFDIWVQTVRPGDVQPSGTVAILLDGSDVSGPIPLFGVDDVSSGVEVTITAPTTPGSGTIGAAYSGDDDTNPSTALTFTQAISGPSDPGSTPKPTPTPTAPGVVATGPPPVATTPAALSAMTKPLLQALRHNGLNALGKVRQTLTVHAPGTLSQAVYTPTAPATATAAKTKPLLIAKATHRFTKPGAGTLRLRMTAAGRRLARRAGTLTVQIVTRFTPMASPPVIANTRVKVKAVHR